MIKNNNKFKIILCCISLINFVFSDSIVRDYSGKNKIKYSLPRTNASGGNIQSLDKIIVFVNN